LMGFGIDGFRRLNPSYQLPTRDRDALERPACPIGGHSRRLMGFAGSTHPTNPYRQRKVGLNGCETHLCKWVRQAQPILLLLYGMEKEFFKKMFPLCVPSLCVRYSVFTCS